MWAFAGIAIRHANTSLVAAAAWAAAGLVAVLIAAALWVEVRRKGTA